MPLSVLIWTTTPWTLPANVAIALKPEADYGIYRVGGELLLLADALAESVFARAGRGRSIRLGGAKGTELVGAAVRHPFLDRDSLLVGADYVDLDTGTGAVHTAPGHGADDFDTGVRFGLPILIRSTRPASSPRGRTLRRPRIFEANARIVADLAQAARCGARRVRALLSALLALQQPGDLPGYVAMVHRDGQ